MRNLLFGIILLSSFTVFSQLPEQWLGHFKGELTSINLAGKESKFGMELKISEREDSTYNFTIVYKAEGVHQERAYQLIPDGPNHFLLDELNGIVCDMSLGKDRLVSLFEVQDNLIHVSYILTKKGIRFELTSSMPAKTSGGLNNDNNEQIPEVQSYKTVSFQFAPLKRQKS